MSILEKIRAQSLIQNPPESYVVAINKLYQWIEKILIINDTCLINDSRCSNKEGANNKTIHSHAISKSIHLKPISNKMKVKILVDDYGNPLKKQLKETAIKKATVFPGFCKYHDQKIFKPVESSIITNYTKQHIFLFCLRAVAYKRYLCEKEYKVNGIILRDFWNNIVLCALKEEIKLKLRLKKILSKHKKIVASPIYIVFYAVFFYCKVGIDLYTAKKINMQNYKALDEAANKLANQLKEKCYSCFEYKIIKTRENKIAFSSVYNIPGRKNCLLFLIVLPSKVETTIIIACFQNDYNYIIKDSFGELCFSGDLKTIQNLIDLEPESIVFNGSCFDEYSWGKYVYETNDQIGKIFKPDLFK